MGHQHVAYVILVRIPRRLAAYLRMYVSIVLLVHISLDMVLMQVLNALRVVLVLTPYYQVQQFALYVFRGNILNLFKVHLKKYACIVHLENILQVPGLLQEIIVIVAQLVNT